MVKNIRLYLLVIAIDSPDSNAVVSEIAKLIVKIIIAKSLEMIAVPQYISQRLDRSFRKLRASGNIKFGRRS